MKKIKEIAKEIVKNLIVCIFIGLVVAIFVVYIIDPVLNLDSFGMFVTIVVLVIISLYLWDILDKAYKKDKNTKID
ncbi:MAG: hypothetical protein PQ975_06820 [Methanobacterium sp.]|jgi:uncharacterized membrane protein